MPNNQSKIAQNCPQYNPVTHNQGHSVSPQQRELLQVKCSNCIKKNMTKCEAYVYYRQKYN